MRADATKSAGTEMDDDAVAMAWLKAQVEALSDQQPMWSRSAYTHSRTSHVAFCNGAVKIEGQPSAILVGTVRDLAEATLSAIREHRAGIDGPVLLTWRCEPEVRRDGEHVRVYTRLALEPDLWA